MKGYRVIIGVLVLIIISLFALSVSFQRTLQMETAEQFNKQQLLLVKAEAANIQGYFARIKDEVLHLAQSVHLLQTRREADFIFLTNPLFRDSGTVRKGIEFLDINGAVLYRRGELKAEAPGYAHLVKTAKTFCPGDVIFKQDMRTAVIAAPVCRPGSDLGAIVVSIDIQDLARFFLSPIKSGSRGYAWLMDEKGNLLYHPLKADMVGRNLYKSDETCFKCHKSFEVEKKIIESKGDNFGRHLAPTGEDKILAFSSVPIGYSRWIVAVSAPYSEVTMSIRRSMRVYTWIIILVFLVSSSVTVMLIVLQRKKEQAEHRVRRQKELEMHAAELEKKVELRTSELSAEKEKLNTIVSAVGSGLILVDTRGKIEWVNQTMHEMAGKDLTGMYCEEICSDCAVVGSYNENDIQTEILSNLFGRSDKFFQVTTAPVKGDTGDLHGYIRLVHDVTEMKRMEEQMIYSEKLACLERLTAGIAHEIGNPLTSVFSFIELLDQMEHDEFKKETLETIYFHMNRIADILKQLSGFSKIPSMQLRVCKVNSLIEDTLNLIQYDRRAQDITIMRELSPALPEIVTDKNQLSQVVVNIILNAADAMPGGGTLRIQTLQSDARIKIIFEDTGVGIDQEHLGRLFDPFFTTKEAGTGLGLAVSYKIIKKLNGDLAVESEKNKGSRFIITLPV